MRNRTVMSPPRVWASAANGTMELRSLTDETLEGALNVIRKSFFVHENVSKGVQLCSEPGASEELEELCWDAAKDGISLVAVNVDNGEVVGVAFNKMQVLDESAEKTAFERFSDNCKYKSSKALVDFMIDVDAKINLFKHYNVDCIFEIMFLATLPDKQKRGIGELLVSTSIEVAKELKKGNAVKTPVTINGDNAIQNAGSIPGLVSAIMTSNFSQKIARKCGFENLISVSYEEFQFNGKTFRESIGDEHQCCVLVAKRLS